MPRTMAHQVSAGGSRGTPPGGEPRSALSQRNFALVPIPQVLGVEARQLPKATEYLIQENRSATDEPRVVVDLPVAKVNREAHRVTKREFRVIAHTVSPPRIIEVPVPHAREPMSDAKPRTQIPPEHTRHPTVRKPLLRLREV